MLSLKSGYPFGVINKKVIYVNDEEDDTENLSKIIDIGNKHKFELAIPEKSFRMAIFAPSGAGKSTFCATVITNYKIKHKKNKVYMISPTKDDEAYDSVKKNIEYIKIDDSLLSDPLNFTEFNDCLIVFDDTEVLSTNQQLNSALEMFRNQILENGRKRNISCIVINHVGQNGLQTKKVINECDLVVLFPKSNFSSVSRLTKQYYGFSKNELEYIRAIRSRWIVIKRTYPQAILSEHALKIV